MITYIEHEKSQTELTLYLPNNRGESQSAPYRPPFGSFPLDYMPIRLKSNHLCYTARNFVIVMLRFVIARVPPMSR
jgi:hypothetical protein